MELTLKKVYKIPPIEEVFSSKGRIKILKLLVFNESMNISEIVKQTRMNNYLVTQHLNYFKELGIIDEKLHGRRIKIYRLVANKHLVHVIQKIILDWKMTQEMLDDKVINITE